MFTDIRIRLKLQFCHMNGMLVLTVQCHASDLLQPDGGKLSALLTFHITNTTIWCLVTLAYAEASIDYTTLGI